MLLTVLYIKVSNAAFRYTVLCCHLELKCCVQCFCTWSSKLKFGAQSFYNRTSGLKGWV